MTTPFLQACPFCQSQAAVFMQEIVNGNDKLIAAHAFCDACEAKGPECKTIDDASAMWNRALRGMVAQGDR